jgi:hypothetical protein
MEELRAKPGLFFFLLPAAHGLRGAAPRGQGADLGPERQGGSADSPEHRGLTWLAECAASRVPGGSGVLWTLDPVSGENPADHFGLESF